MELTNAAGCLTAAGLRAAADAPPGGVPPDLARHLASCASCQRRLLDVDRGAALVATAKGPPSPRRLALTVLALLAVLAAVLWTTRLLLG